MESSTSCRLSRPVCLADYERKAIHRLGRTARDYYSTGAGNEDGLRNNREAFSRLLLRWRTMQGISSVDLSTTVLGQKVNIPVGVSPTAFQKMAHPDGEAAVARACGRAGTVMTLSTLSTTSMEEISAQAPSTLRWLQLYISADRRFVAKDLIRRAERQGFTALVLTIDCPKSGKRHAEQRNPLSLPRHLDVANFDPSYSQSFVSKSSSRFGIEEVSEMLGGNLSWDDVDWLRSVSRLPIIAKGVMTAADAREAVSRGVSGVWVSNHGARQLESTPATIEALPEVVSAVDGRCEVYLDGGVRCGTDVLKALALGANAVFIGRPALWGLACDGENGVVDTLRILKEELELAMMLSGCSSLQDIPPDLVIHEYRYRSKL